MGRCWHASFAVVVDSNTHARRFSFDLKACRPVPSHYIRCSAIQVMCTPPLVCIFRYVGPVVEYYIVDYHLKR